MSAMFSVVIVLPAALEEAGNRCAVALGHDSAPLPGRTFTFRLSADGSEPATHVATRTQARQSFLDQMAAAAAGMLPEGAPAGGTWSDYGITAEEAVAVAQAAVPLSVRDGGEDGGQHAADAFAARGLKVVEAPD